MSEPDLLILDEPFDGLDVASHQQLAELLASLHQSGITLVLVLNRFDEIPEFVQFAGVLADCTLAETGAKEELLQQALVAQLAHSEQLEGVQLPEPDEPSARHALPANEPRIVLNNGVVSYNERPILNNLSWQVNPGEHWQIVGTKWRGKIDVIKPDYWRSSARLQQRFDAFRTTSRQRAKPSGISKAYRLRQQ